MIECALALRFLFGLPLRATEGLLQSLTRLLKLLVEVPDYTTLSKRQRSLPLTLKCTGSNQAMDIVLDSTGLKVFGEGEWKRRQHGKSYRRTWRKIHLAVNVQTFDIEGAMLTEASCHDGEVLPVLVKSIQAPIGKLIGDGAYDHQTNYQYLDEHDIKAIIPPRHNATITQHGNCQQKPLRRDEALRQIRRYGRQGWKKRQGYSKRSLAETMMYCFKTAFGGRLQNRLLTTQAVEVGIKCNILNQFQQLGRPGSYAED